MVHNGLVDLHVHSNRSDGTWSPKAMVQAAKERGLVAVALTDHDTVEGVEEAVEAGKRHGIEVVPGLELSTELGQSEVHVLGYFLDIDSPNLHQLLVRMREGRRTRVDQMVRQLQSLGMDIKLEEVHADAGSGAIGRPHVARVLVRKRYAASVRDAFDRLIGRGKPGYVPRPKLDPLQAISAIQAASGIPVLAHPGLVAEMLPIGDFVQGGLMGIEVYYPEHRAEMITRFLTIAEHYGLIATGGSDCHGPGAKAHTTLGYPRVDYRVVQQLSDAKRGLSS